MTTRTVQGRFLLKPSAAVNMAIKGTLGRAQRYTGLRVIACVFLSNHYHLLVEPDSEEQLARFMQFLNTNLSKQIGRLHGWRGPLFDRRYQAIPVSDEEEAQVARLRYLLEHGAKENLVERSQDWPGVHCVRELRDGQNELFGYWQERARVSKAKRAGGTLKRGERVTRERTRLSSLPVWRARTAADRRTAVRELLGEIEERTRARRQAERERVLGVWGVQLQHPHDAPDRPKRSPAPIAHAATLRTWLAMKGAYRAFVEQYRHASLRWRAGLGFAFPAGCFLPRGPYYARGAPG